MAGGDLRAAVERLSAPESAPSAGSAAAIAAAVAAGVVAKVAERGGDAAAAVQARTLAERLTALATRDAEVLTLALAALERAAESADGGATTASADFALGRTLEQAAVVPLRIAEAAADVATLAAELAAGGRVELAEDAVTAAMLAAGASRAAAHLVGINLAAQPGSRLTERALAAAAAAAVSAEGAR